MKTLTFLLFVAGMAHYSTQLSAQDNKDQTIYTFEDELVTGDLLVPDEGEVPVRRRDGAKSLIKVRMNFVPQMFKTVEDV